MMTIKEIYENFDQIGCVTFSTLAENGYVESRIAHFFAYDEEGLYFRTMDVKPFYRELKQTGKVSVCGMYPSSQVSHDENNLPSFVPGYTMRITGDMRELTMDKVEEAGTLTWRSMTFESIPERAFLCSIGHGENAMTLITQKKSGIISWNVSALLMAECLV